MKRLLLIALFGCKPGGCLNHQAAVEAYLGEGAVCGTSHHDTLRCTRGGRLFVCTINDGRVGCAAGDAPLPEGK